MENIVSDFMREVRSYCDRTGTALWRLGLAVSNDTKMFAEFEAGTREPRLSTMATVRRYMADNPDGVHRQTTDTTAST